ncbi:MAG: carboxyl transferase domain-containing protein [Thermoanaerobaculia bacterium]
MPKLSSAVDTEDATFRANHERMSELIRELRELEARVREHGDRAAEKFRQRGQLLPRERVERLLDPGSPLLELSTLAGLGMHDDDGGDGASGGGSIAGIGFVAGVRCLIAASDSAIKGGAVSPMGLEKSLRVQEIALRNKLPVINLVESAGANLLYQSEIFVAGGRIFANLARLSARGIPIVTIVHGSSTAGGAYLPGLSDYVVAVKNRARVFLAGPPLVKAALGEDAGEEELGGADMHATVTGSAEYVADDDREAIAVAREIVAKLGWNAGSAPERPSGSPSFAEPCHDTEELLGLVPSDYRTRYDSREVIARLVDGSDFLDFKSRYGPHTVCGHAAIFGHPCGILSNNGPIDPDGSTKAAHFIQLCCQSGTPIVYLQNTTGYMVGLEAEAGGIVKHGSKMIQAVANATVPQITLMIGASFGAGNYGMCGRAFDPRFIFAWPNARVAVMGGAQAAGVMEMITRAKLTRKGATVDERMLTGLRHKIIAQIDAESTALYATARLWDDGVIDPRDSRKVLGFVLATCREAETRELRPSSFGVARM